MSDDEGGSYEEAPSKPKVADDQPPPNLLLCSGAGCGKPMPCKEHQGLLFSKNPSQHFEQGFQALVSKEASLIQHLLQWAQWVQRSADEDRWELAANLQMQALAVHYHEPQIPDEDYSVGTEDYESEYWDRLPHVADDASPEEKAKYQEAVTKQKAERLKRREARQQREVLRQKQFNAKMDIWRHVYALEKALLTDENAGVPQKGFTDFVQYWEELRTKISYERQHYERGRDWTVGKGEMNYFFTSILEQMMEECCTLAGLKPDTFAMVFLGSLGRGEGLPFSDVEIAAVLKEKKFEVPVFKAIRIFRVHLIFLGETPQSLSGTALEKGFPTEDGKDWSFTTTGLHYDTGVTLRVDTIKQLVATQVEQGVDVVTRTALRQVSRMCGDAVLVQQYKDAVSEWISVNTNLRKDVCRELLVQAINKYDPAPRDAVDLKPAYRMISLTLDALCVWHGISGSGCMSMISQLRAKGVLSWDDALALGGLLNSLMLTRISARLHARTQKEVITKSAQNGQPAAWRPHEEVLLGNLKQFHTAAQTYLPILEKSIPFPRPLCFVLPVAATGPKAAAPVIVGKQHWPKLVMVKDHLQPLLSLGTRMALGGCCKGLRALSPGIVTVVPIHSSIDAQIFLDGPPTLGSHILLLGGYWATQRPYSKRHAIPKSTWDRWHAEDKRRQATMKFSEDTLKLIMKIRPHHRVVGITFGKGQKTLTEDQYVKFWEQFSPGLGWVRVEDQDQRTTQMIGSFIKNKPFLGAFAQVYECGNCWPLVQILVNTNNNLESLSLQWSSTNDMYYHGARFEVPTDTEMKTMHSLPELRNLRLRIPAEEGKSISNYEILSKWLLPRAKALKRLVGLSLERGWDSKKLTGPRMLDALRANCPALSYLQVSGVTDNDLRDVLALASVETLELGSNYDNLGATLSPDVRGIQLRHLFLGAMYGMKKASLVNILKACPNLITFNVSSIEDLTPADAPELELLLPNAKFVKIASRDNKPIVKRPAGDAPAKHDNQMEDDE